MSKPNYRPEGFNSVTPYLSVEGATEAIEWYKKAFGAAEHFKMPTPDGKLMHAEIRIGDSMIMLADTCAEHNPARPAALHLYIEDADATFARAVELGAKGERPVQDMFWGDRMGSIVDPYGHTWSLSTHVRDVPPEEIAAAAEAMFAEHASPSV